jgi:hypothetical protein
MGVPIRLTNERWAHIIEEHNELAGLRLDVLEAVGQPERIVAGRASELLAIREHEPGKWLVVVYGELVDDGFIITAFLTSRSASLMRRRQMWP